MVNAEFLLPGAVITHVETGTDYVVESNTIKLRNPDTRTWYGGIRYRNVKGEEYVRAAWDFESFELALPVVSKELKPSSPTADERATLRLSQPILDGSYITADNRSVGSPKSLRAHEPDEATWKALTAAHLDITGAAMVQVSTNKGRDVLWVNVNDVCVLRICRIQELKT